MMPINKKISFLFIISILLLLSCSKEKDKDEPIEIPTIRIYELSSNHLLEGDILTITGENFINDHFPTKININNVLYDITPISNTKIELTLTSDYGFGSKNISINISDKNSNTKKFFIMPKDWYKISNDRTIKIFIFDDTEEIFSLTIYDGYPSGYIYNYKPDENGYSHESIFSYYNQYLDLEMISKDVGLTLTRTKIKYTLDGFQTVRVLDLGNDWHYNFNDSEYPYNRILDINVNGFILGNGLTTYFRSSDAGLSYESHCLYPTLNPLVRDGNVGKGSNGIYYNFGLYYERDGSYNHLVMSSPNGYDNWNIISNSLPYNGKIIKNMVFYDYNLIYSINENHELIKSTDLTQTWEFVRSNVDKFFMKSETEWYMISQDKLYHTTNSGTDWNFELDLPANSEAFDMCFTNGKTAISGSNYIYIKHE